MNTDVLHVAMATWAKKDLPARLHSGQVAKLLNCSQDDVSILATAGKLRPLGKPKRNAVRYFSTIELITMVADREWLDGVTRTIGQYWRRKNERRRGSEAEEDAAAEGDGAESGDRKPSVDSSVKPSVTG